MHKKLFLSSFKDVAPLLSSFEENLIGKRVKAGKKALEKLELIVDELELSLATPEEIKLKIVNNDIIYVTGGNTFF